MAAAPKPEIGTTPDRQPGLSVATRPSTTALIRPAASPLVLLELHKEIANVVGSILVAGTDYGVIPGTGDKPALLKPGAERVCFAFGCAPKYEVVDRQIEHDREVKWTKRKKVWRNAHRGDREFTWQEESGTSLGLYRYEVRCSLVRREDGAAVAEGMASCSTMESKYIDRPRDTENTVLKMAQKRALVAAVLNGFGLSDRFTQDVEETAPSPEFPMAEPTHRPKARAPQAASPTPPVTPHPSDLRSEMLDSEPKDERDGEADEALTELELLLPNLSVDQQIYVREKLADGADPARLLAVAQATAGRA